MRAKLVPTRTFHVWTSFTPTLTSISLNHFTTTLALFVVFIFAEVECFLQVGVDTAFAFVIDFFALLAGFGSAKRTGSDSTITGDVFGNGRDELQTGLVSAKHAERTGGLVDWELGLEIGDQISRKVLFEISEIELGAAARGVVFFSTSEGEGGG